jgi:ribosomal protein S18 acetylase RimI-like enzyme
VLEQTLEISSRAGLDPDDLAAVRALLARSNAHDGTELIMSLRPPATPGDNVPLYILAREGERIVGALELVGYLEVEGCLIVAPEARRRGIARRLAARAREELARRGVANWLLVCDEIAPAGAAFARAIGGTRAYAEYRLALDPARVPPPREEGPPLALRRAEAADAETIGAITASAFGDPPADVTRWARQDLDRPDRRWFLASRDGVPVGSLRVIAKGGEADITAFGVLPAHQGRGYGRAILSRTIALLLAEGLSAIYIETETDNAAALGLYRSCGFVERHTYGYYRVAVMEVRSEK